MLHVREHRIDDNVLKPVARGLAIRPQRLTFEQFVLGNITRRGSPRSELGYLQPLIRRRFLDLHGLRYNEALRLGEDFDLYARALVAGARFLVTPMQGYVAVEQADRLAHVTADNLEALGNSIQKLMTMEHLNQSQREALARLHRDIDRRTQWLVLVKSLQSHNYAQSLSTFFRSPPLSWYLAERLIAEVPRQLRKRLGRLCRQ